MSLWKRGFIEIVSEILEALLNSSLKKTHITFKCNLDSRAVTKYLRIMMETRLVEKSSTDPSLYLITQKGILYLHRYQLFANLVEKDLQNISDKSILPKQIMARVSSRAR